MVTGLPVPSLPARLIATASARSQIIVVSHSETLVSALNEERSCTPLILEKELGETQLRDGPGPSWTWPSR